MVDFAAIETDMRAVGNSRLSVFLSDIKERSYRGEWNDRFCQWTADGVFMKEIFRLTDINGMIFFICQQEVHVQEGLAGGI